MLATVAAFTCTTCIQNNCLFRIKLSCKHIGISHSILIPSDPNEWRLPFGTTHLRMPVLKGRTETTIRPWHFAPERSQNDLKCLKIACVANCTTPAVAGRCLVYSWVPKGPKQPQYRTAHQAYALYTRWPVRPGCHPVLEHKEADPCSTTRTYHRLEQRVELCAPFNNNLTLREHVSPTPKTFYFMTPRFSLRSLPGEWRSDAGTTAETDSLRPAAFRPKRYLYIFI